MTIHSLKKRFFVVGLSFLMSYAISVGAEGDKKEGEGTRYSITGTETESIPEEETKEQKSALRPGSARSTRSMFISSPGTSIKSRSPRPQEEVLRKSENPSREAGTRKKPKNDPRLMLDLSFKEQGTGGRQSSLSKRSGRSVSVSGPQKPPSDRPLSSPRLSSPRLTTPRSRSMSLPNDQESVLDSFAKGFRKKITPRQEWPKEWNDEEIERRFQEWGMNPLATPEVLLKREFYLEYTKTTGAPCVSREGEWTEGITVSSYQDIWGMDIHGLQLSTGTLELIAASGVFFMRKIGFGSDRIKNLCQEVCGSYRDLLGRPDSKWEHRYHAAECFASMGSHDSDKQAWDHLVLCIPSLTVDVGFDWMKTLMGRILKKLREPDSSIKAKRYYQIAELARKIDELTVDNSASGSSGSSEESGSESTDFMDFYLESVFNLHCAHSDNSFYVMNQLQWGPQVWPCDVLFSVACKAYRQGIQEKEEQVAHRFLTISRDFFKQLIVDQKISNYHYTNITTDLIESVHPEDSRLLIALKALIFVDMGKAIWEEQQDQSKGLLFKACEMNYNPQMKYGIDWVPEILAGMIDYVANMDSQSINNAIWSKMIHDFCRELIRSEYTTPAYVSALQYFQNTEMWVTAFNLSNLVSDWVPPSHQEALQGLKSEIEPFFQKAQAEKRFLRNKFNDMINFIVSNQGNAEKLRDYGVACIGDHLMTQEQWDYLANQQVMYLKVTGSHTVMYSIVSGGDQNADFRHKERRDFVERIHETLGLSKALGGLPEEWHLPEESL